MKHYRACDLCTFTEDMREYDLLKAYAKLFTENCPRGHKYIVHDTYFDLGQDWVWTTILDVDSDCQILCPRDWLEIVNEERPQVDIMKDYFNDPHCSKVVK